MHRLIEWLYEVLFGIRIKTHDQHIADLEQMLARSLDDQLRINIEVTQLTQRLLDAMARRDDLNNARAKCRRFDMTGLPVPESYPAMPQPAKREEQAIDWSAMAQFDLKQP